MTRSTTTGVCESCGGGLILTGPTTLNLHAVSVESADQTLRVRQPMSFELPKGYTFCADCWTYSSPRKGKRPSVGPPSLKDTPLVMVRS